MSDLCSYFRQEHARLRALLDQLSSPTAPADRAGLLALWVLFAGGLKLQFRLEEAQLLPLIDRSHAADCRRVRYEHDRIRDLLSDLTALAEAGGLFRQTLDELATALEAHAKWEGSAIHPLMDARIDPGQLQRIIREQRSPD